MVFITYFADYFTAYFWGDGIFYGEIGFTYFPFFVLPVALLFYTDFYYFYYFYTSFVFFPLGETALTSFDLSFFATDLFVFSF